MNRRLLAPCARFAAWRWQDIFVDGGLYLRKLYLLRTPWFQWTIHWIRKADPGRDLHDHPSDFASVILRGGYIEERPTGWDLDDADRWIPRTERTYHKAPTILYRNAEALHRIASVDAGTVTMVLWGRKRRKWGFQTPEGWRHWREVVNQ